MARILLITGGARSGKSTFAEDRAAAYAPPWAYLATAEARDTEMTARIRLHQTRRDPDWHTHEDGTALVETLRRTEDGFGVRLVDCLTLWLSRLMEEDADIALETGALCDYLRGTKTPVILVGNEVGLGIVPANALARAFRDEAGRLNQAVAAVADEVVFMVAGLPMTVKPA